MTSEFPGRFSSFFSGSYAFTRRRRHDLSARGFVDRLNSDCIFHCAGRHRLRRLEIHVSKLKFLDLMQNDNVTFDEQFNRVLMQKIDCRVKLIHLVNFINACHKSLFINVE